MDNNILKLFVDFCDNMQICNENYDLGKRLNNIHLNSIKEMQRFIRKEMAIFCNKNNISLDYIKDGDKDAYACFTNLKDRLINNTFDGTFRVYLVGADDIYKYTNSKDIITAVNWGYTDPETMTEYIWDMEENDRQLRNFNPKNKFKQLGLSDYLFNEITEKLNKTFTKYEFEVEGGTAGPEIWATFK